MKKVLKAGKKPLSLLLAVVMLITTWVFIAPNKADAATAGNYRVRVYLDINDKAYSGDQTIHIDYYTNNGTGTAATDSSYTFGTFNDGDIDACVDNIPGFPYRVRVYSTGLNLWGSSVKYGINVYVAPAGSSSFTAIYTEGNTSRSHSGTSSFTDTANISTSNFPYVSTFPDTATVSRDIYLPTMLTTGRYSSNTVTIGQAKDQYGVNYIDPETITVSGSACGTTGLTTSKNGSVLTVTGANTAKNEDAISQTATVVAKWKSANPSYNTTSTYRSKTYSSCFTIYNPEHRVTFNGNGGTITSNSVVKYYAGTVGTLPTGTRSGYSLIGFYPTAQGPFLNENTPTGTKLTSDYTVKANSMWYAAWRANKYTATFNYKVADGENAKDATTSVTDYYSKTLTAPTYVKSYIDGDYKWSFTGWSPAVPETMTAGNITYTAQYSPELISADYTEVDNQIDRANEKMAEAEYRNKYTPETVKELDDAIAAVVRDLGRSQQGRVDEFAARIRRAVDGLKIKKFTVLFVDEEGKLINKDALKFVNYGEVITVPDTVTKDYDATYHYEFAGWDTSGNSDYDPNNKQVTVTDDLTFIAKFTPIKHQYTDKEIESSCTTNGVIEHTCTCGYSYTEANPDDVAHHRFPETYTTLKAATCSAEGIEAIVCDDCGAVKPDSIRSIDKLGHTFGDWTTLTPATCWGKGTERRDCANCDAYEVRETAKLDHAWDTEAEGADANGWVNVAATCEADGYRYRTCTACQLVQREKTTDKLDHPAANRVVDEVVATCKNAGYRLETCDLCGKVISFTTTAQLTTHTWDTTVAGADENGWVTVIAKSCTQKEVKKRVCSVCGKEEVAISADFLPHTEIKDAAVAATCTHTGLTEGKHCDVCKQVLVAQTETPALGHNYDSAWTTESEATCQSNGYEVQICDRDGCGEILNTRVKDAIPHVWDTSVEGADADGWVTTTAATCTEDGEAERTCIATTGHHHTETKVLPKLGHDWGEWTQSKAPTCTEPGEEQRVCGNDNTHVETRKVPATGHNYTTDVKQPTCTDAGYTKHTCACGDEYFTDIVNPNGHHFVEDKTAYVEPTNTQPGQKVFYCDNKDCTVRYTVELAPQGHTFAKDEANSQAPKCTEPGWNTFKCTAHENCGIKYREELPELGHHFVLDHEKTIPASCLTDGTNAYKCDRDGCTATMTETVKAVGHDMQFVEHIDADCIHYGRDIYKCSKCNYTEERQIDTEKPTGTHDFGVLLVVAPTCTQQGFTVFKCRVCDATFRGDFKEPLGHAWDEGHHVDPTCTEPGGTLYTCTRTETYVDENGKTQTKQCGATKLEDEEPALGHDMGQWYFAADGDHYVNKRDCNREGCPYSEYEEINGEKVVYYKVDFVSYKYVGEYYTAGDGTKLAYSMDEQPDAYDEVIVDTQYIKSGEPCEYAGKKLGLPKTKAFGVYNLTGWNLDKGDLSNVTTNITAKAQFQGEEIYYEVNFYSYDGHLVKGPVHVLHGHPVAKDDRPFDEYVTRPNNNQYKYEFTGEWDRDIEAIYATGPIHAVFKQIPLTYKVVFHDWDGKVITSQILGYGEGVNESNKIIFDNMKPRKEDDAYIYEWTPASRRWVDAKGNIIDENHVKVPDNQGYQEYTPEKEKDEFLSDREKGIFHVYASYPQKVKYYRFNVSAKYADGSIAEGATVTVQSPDGQLVYTTKLNEKGTATVTVEHYEYVTVNITGGGETNSLKIRLGKDNIVDGYFGNEGDEIPSFAFELSNYVDPDPDHGGSTKCRCICHTFLGGLWINFLNILYRLFGKKTVCCHDMYEKHGDRLAYGK